MQPAISNAVRSLKSLKDEIRNSIFPSGESENLVTAHDLMFIEGLGEIQKWVQPEQSVNCNVIRFCKTYHKQGMTVVPCPKGIVTRVYTIADDEWNRPVFFYPRDWPEPESWSRRLRGRFIPLHTERAKTGVDKLPLGFQYAEPWHDLKMGVFDEPDDSEQTTQDDTPGQQPYEVPQRHHHRFERARHGIYAIHDHNIYMAPWIQSNEMVVIEWYGIKNSSEWTDDDLVSDAVDFKKALKLYVQYAHYRDFGEKEDYEKFHNSDNSGLYDEALADLMWQAREETKLRGNKIPSRHEGFSYIDSVLAGNAARQLGLHKNSPHHHHHHEYHDEDETIVFGHMGNNGCGSANSDLVAWLVKLWHPSFIVASGNTTPNPIAPVLTAVSGSSLEIDLSWTPASLDFAFTYNIYRSLDPNFQIDPSNLIASNIPATQLTYQDTQVVTSSTYYYYVQAVDLLNETELSNIASATPTFILTAPFLTGYAFGGFEIILGWTASQVSLVPAGYLYSVYRSSTQNFIPGPDTLAVQTNALQFIDGSPFVSSGNTYYYIVVATDAAGNTAQSNEIGILLPVSGTGPSAPTLVATSASTSEIDLTWGASSGTATIRYNVYGMATSLPFTPGSGNLLASGLSGTSFPATGLAAGTTYSFYVVANNDYGSSISNEATATTVPPPPSAPVLSLTYVSPTELDLMWGVSDGAGVTYSVYRSTSLVFTPGPSTLIAPGITSPRTYQDTSVTNADTTNYYYYVVASNSGGTAQSNEAFNSVYLIPVMIDNTDPSGVASANQNNSSAYAGFNFGGNTTVTLNWHSTGAPTLPAILQYDFGAGNPHAANQYRIWVGACTSVTFSLQGSNDGSSWTILDTVTTSSTNTYFFYSIANSTAYRYYRMYIPSYTGAGELAITFQLYGG